MDDAVVWLDYHQSEIYKRDKKIAELEADLAFLTEAHKELVLVHDLLRRERVCAEPWTIDGLID